MTRFRIRLLITLALFAAVAVAGVVTASAAEHRSDGTGSTTVTVTKSPRPAVRPCTGEPDLGSGNSPSKFGSRGLTPPVVEGGHGHDLGRYGWAGRIWAAWLSLFLR